MTRKPLISVIEGFHFISVTEGLYFETSQQCFIPCLKYPD